MLIVAAKCICDNTPLFTGVEPHMGMGCLFIRDRVLRISKDLTFLLFMALGVGSDSFVRVTTH